MTRQAGLICLQVKMSEISLDSSALRINRVNLLAFLDALFERFDAAFICSSEEVVVHIGGSKIICRSNLPAYVASVGKGLADEGPFLDGSCRIIVTSSGGLGLPMTPLWGEPFYQERLVEAVVASSRYRVHHLTDSRFWQFYDRHTHRGIQLMAEPTAAPAWDAGSPLRNFLHWFFSSRGYGLVHAGTLALDSSGLLLAGPGGSGKSGTVLAGIRHGLQTVGDDYVLIQIGQTSTAMPLFRTLKQDAKGFERMGLSQLPDLSRELNWQGKHQFTLSDVSTEKHPCRIELLALCLPVITYGERTHFEPIDSKSAFLSLVPSGVTQMPGDRDASFVFGAKLSRQLPAYRLKLGTDPAEIASAIGAFIRSRRSC